MKRLLLSLALLATPAWGDIVCTGTANSCGGSGSGTVVSPVTTDPILFEGVATFNNAANTPLTAADGILDSTLTSGRVCTVGASGRLSSDADLTFATDTLTATKAIGSTSVCAVGALDAANSVCLSSSSITAEGSTADGNEGVLAFGDATADNTLTLLATASGIELNPTTGNLLTQIGTGTARASVGGTLCKGVGIATTGTSEEVLATCTIPANTLTANGSIVVLKFFGHAAANGNNKQLRVRIGGLAGTLLLDTGAVASNASAYTTTWPLTIQRLSATTATVWGSVSRFTNAIGSTVQGSAYASASPVSITWANAQDLVITGTTPTSSGDMTLDTYIGAVER